MVIKKKPEVSTTQEEAKRNKFISQGGQVASDKKNDEFTKVLFRIPVSVLEKLDESLKQKPWMTRTQWILEAIIDKLKYEK